MSNKENVEKEAMVLEVKAVLEKEYGREFSLEESQKVFNTIDQFATIVVAKWFRNKGKMNKTDNQ